MADGVSGETDRHAHYTDDFIRDILSSVKVIAMVGASANWKRPSFFAMKYLQKKGYRVIPVNPREEGNTILGETAYATLKDIPDKIDMVDCFRASEAIGPIAREAVEVGAKVLWMQLGVRNDEAAAYAEKHGLKVVMNRCPKIEFARLYGELGWSGVSTGVISSKRAKVRAPKKLM
jgi:predicted CoA-binding protein